MKFDPKFWLVQQLLVIMVCLYAQTGSLLVDSFFLLLIKMITQVLIKCFG